MFKCRVMCYDKIVTAFLGLGSNLGDRFDALRQARSALQGLTGVRVTGSSALYETEPIGGPQEQPCYYNAVVQIATELAPELLLERCLGVEAALGRERLERWGPRTIDIDLLFHDTTIRQGGDLVLPHPRLHLRSFVLTPLHDLAADFVHPLLGKTVRQLLRDLPPGAGLRRLARVW